MALQEKLYDLSEQTEELIASSQPHGLLEVAGAEHRGASTRGGREVTHGFADHVRRESRNRRGADVPETREERRVWEGEVIHSRLVFQAFQASQFDPRVVHSADFEILRWRNKDADLRQDAHIGNHLLTIHVSTFGDVHTSTNTSESVSAILFHQLGGLAHSVTKPKPDHANMQTSKSLSSAVLRNLPCSCTKNLENDTYFVFEPLPLSQTWTTSDRGEVSVREDNSGLTSDSLTKKGALAGSSFHCLGRPRKNLPGPSSPLLRRHHTNSMAISSFSISLAAL